MQICVPYMDMERDGEMAKCTPNARRVEQQNLQNKRINKNGVTLAHTFDCSKTNGETIFDIIYRGLLNWPISLAVHSR